MDPADRIERALRAAVAPLSSPDSPPTLIAAVQHAIFPGGSRVRPRLCLAVASACGDAAPALSEATAVAIELIHCASLVHDDLPCFDDAPVRRGLPSVHAAFGQPLAVLAGDQLIALSFEVLAQAALVDALPAPQHAVRAVRLTQVVGRAVGVPHGIIGGQGWESESCIPAAVYRRAKTGALFEAAAVGGAVAAGQDGGAWRTFGQRIGEAYQLADDLLDVSGDPEEIGKPVGRDEALGRPNVAVQLGVHGTRRLLRELVHEAIEAMPSCYHADELRAWVRELSEKLSIARRPPSRLHAGADTA
ncbi:polyprenyl synthetase family protein [Chondromyces apiculatus]|uniref:Geranylgeranyl diphosphate synthase n=1 Tax=Chondromyces apiculatus DSM 436 TaxID=1192034 RepID=A0A017T5E7_9BACT|nr:polyprenyl synthetase family protein [Chondromyces apiculatus]EYF03791.1 Geranylgeranyl diphosphate synthase [Chondromyces apiculatus DSM 436]